MRIAIATDLYFPSVGGVEIETQRIAEELVKQGNDIWIIAPHVKNYVDIKNNGIKIVRIKPRRILFDPLHIVRKKVFKELNLINPDVVHIQSSLPIARAASYYSNKFQIPCIATGHYADGELEYKFQKVKPIVWLIRYFVKRFHKTVWSKSDIVTFPSKYAGQYYKKIVNNTEKLITLTNGINKPNITNKSVRISQQKTIIYVGRLEPYKNVRTIIRALPSILAKVDANLLIVGAGQCERQLKEEVGKLGIDEKVTFMGFKSGKTIEGIYKKSDIFVIASATDNQPLALLEAISSGLPVVASNVGGIPEIVKDGKNGFLFDPYDTKSLSEKVIKILSNKNLYAKMKRENLKLAKNYDIKEIVFKILITYQKAIAINRLKINNNQTNRVYLTKSFALKLTFFMILLAIFARSVMATPATAKARGTIIKDKLLNLKVIKNIEKMDLNLKDPFINEKRR